MTGYPAPVVTWRKSSGLLPKERVKYYKSALQILYIRKDDSDLYYCAASNLLGSSEKKTLLVVVSPPRFTVKTPAKVYPGVDSTLSYIAGLLVIINLSSAGRNKMTNYLLDEATN